MNGVHIGKCRKHILKFTDLNTYFQELLNHVHSAAVAAADAAAVVAIAAIAAAISTAAAAAMDAATGTVYLEWHL